MSSPYQAQLHPQPQSQRNHPKRRAEHDAELLSLLQGTSIEVTVGVGDEQACWSIPLSRLSTGHDMSPSFLLWSLGDFFKADAFKNRTMSMLYSAYSLNVNCRSLGFIELSWAEVDYCWRHTAPNSKLRTFIIGILSHHVTFSDYIDVKETSDLYKLFVKHPELQLQLIGKIAGSFNHFTKSVADIPGLDKYLDAIKVENQGEANEILEL